MKQSKDFFWPSYVDLMTALFLTMLVLFVLSYKLFRDKQNDLEKTNARLNIELREKKKLDEIKEALDKLADPRYFIYNKEYKRYELGFDVVFEPSSFVLQEQYKPKLVQAGRFLVNQLSSLSTVDSTQYLIVIEGRTARYTTQLADSTYSYETRHNYDGPATRQLSYLRALAVFQLWREAGITFPAPRYEVVPAGSGFGGVNRYTGKYEGRNKRFIIQIQPKIGSIDGQAATP